MIKALRKMITHRVFISGISFIVQIAIISFLTVGLSIRFTWVFWLIYMVGILLVLRLQSLSDINPAYSRAWIIAILAIPLVGTMLYLIFGNRKFPKKLLKRSVLSEQHVLDSLKQDTQTIQEFINQNPQWSKLISFVKNSSNYPVYGNTIGQYYPTGEAAYRAIYQAISEATDYIFLEFFIVKQGEMFDSLLNLLMIKVQQGVDVRIIYDDWGSPELNQSVCELLQDKGIKIQAFNKLSYKLLVQLNNRDHRKIVIVDGKIGFVCGINIADEYINTITRFGYWKDNAVEIRGEAVLSLIEMFLVFWSFCSNQEIEAIDHYVHSISSEEQVGYVLPYADNPTDDVAMSETVHIQAINNAKRNVRIITPYLVIGNEMFLALKNAVIAGVKVEIVVPAIPDKKYVYALTQQNYGKLVEAGVSVYTYTPGFIHQKVLLVDDEMAVISTANMDYRSYYLNFECGIIFFQHPVVRQCQMDFYQITRQSHLVNKQEVQSVSWFKEMYRLIMGLFAQLM